MIVPERPCPRARGRNQTPHEPHKWISGDEHVGDDTYDLLCPGTPTDTQRGMDVTEPIDDSFVEPEATREARTALRALDAYVDCLGALNELMADEVVVAAYFEYIWVGRADWRLEVSRTVKSRKPTLSGPDLTAIADSNQALVRAAFLEAHAITRRLPDVDET